MRILFIHEVGYLEKPIFEMHEFPEHLAAMGHEVAFADFPETGNIETAPNFGVVVQGRVLRGSSLMLYSHRARFSGIVARLIAVLTFPLFFHKVLADFKPDIVVSYAVPTSGWQAAIICKLQRRPFLFRALDVSHKIRRSLFAPLILRAERLVYSTAAWVSCNNPAMLEYCISLGATPDKSSVDYPPLDLSHFLVEQPKLSILKKLGVPPDAQVIVYMGSFFYFSGLDEVVQQLALTDKKVILLLIGGGELDAQLRALTKELNLEDRVIFTGFVNFGELPDYFAIADVAINPMVPSLVSHKALPNKVIQYMAAGLPVVSTKLEGLSSIFSDAVGVKSVNYSFEVLPAAVSMLEKGQVKKLGTDNRAAVATKFDANLAVQKFEDRLISLRLNL